MSNKWVISDCISEKKRTGKVQLVSNQVNPAILGYFKQSKTISTGYSGLLAANEYLAYLLGKELSLPVAEIILTEINDINGIVSLKMVQNEDVYNWNIVKKNETLLTILKTP